MCPYCGEDEQISEISSGNETLYRCNHCKQEFTKSTSEMEYDDWFEEQASKDWENREQYGIFW